MLPKKGDCVGLIRDYRVRNLVENHIAELERKCEELEKKNKACCNLDKERMETINGLKDELAKRVPFEVFCKFVKYPAGHPMACINCHETTKQKCLLLKGA